MAFQSFDPSKPVDASRRNLPHWQQEGATYFVTFRLADSLPASARVHLAELKRLNVSGTFSWLDKYLDAGIGACVLAEPANAKIVASALRHFDGERYRLRAFSIMPNHVHALVAPIASHTLSTVVHSWKSFTARQLQSTATVSGRVWQEESFDRIVRDDDELARYCDYILANPAAAHLKAGTYIVGTGLT